MSDAISPVLFLVETVLQFLQAEIEFFKTEIERNKKVVEDVKKIRGHLRTMQAFLQDAERFTSCTSEMMKNLVERIRDIAFEMEDVLDDYMIHTPRSFSNNSVIQAAYKVCHDIKHWNPVKEIQSKIEMIEAAMSERFTSTVVTDLDMHTRDDIKYRRLSIQIASHASGESPNILHLDIVRSLFMFGSDKISPFLITDTLQKIKLLKVLDLENAPLESFPECILEVALLLRYLSLRNTNVSTVPKGIKRLRYLEYLDLKRTRVSWLPVEIFSLQYLQHLLVYSFSPRDTFNKLQGVEIVGKMDQKELPKSLKKLSIIKVRHSRLFQMLENFTLLKKLGLVSLTNKDKHLLFSCIQKMPRLLSLSLTSSSTEETLDLEVGNFRPKLLQHLYLKGRLETLPKWIPSLSDLVRLLLRWSKLRDSPVEMLHNLPNLMELEMVDAFTGEVLLIDTGGFPKLRTLHIAQFDCLDLIEVRKDGMPMLQKLTIGQCMYLKELPNGIDHLKGLQELLIYDMPQDFTSRLKEDRWRINHIPSIQFF